MKRTVATSLVLAAGMWAATAHAQNRVDTVDVAQPLAVPEQTESVSGEQLEDEGVATVGEALLMLTGAQRVPGTSTASKLSIDGLPSGYLTVLRDGVPVGRAVGGPNGPGIDLDSLTLDPNAVERIEVSRGMGPNGSSGVIVNIVTRRDDPRASVTSRVGAHDGGMHRNDVTATAHAPFGPWSTNAEATLSNRSGADANDDGQLDSPDGQAIAGTVGGGWSEGNDYLRADTRFNTSERKVDGGQGPLDDRVGTTEFGASIDGHWQGSWGRVQHTTWAGRIDHQFDKIVRSSGFVRPKAQTVSTRFGQTAATTFFAGSHDITVAADARGEWVSRNGETGAFDDAFVGETGLSLGERWYVNRHVELSARARGAYAAPWGLAGEAEVGAGFNLDAGWFGNVTASQSRRLPTTEELFLFFDHSEVGYSVVGNPDLSPETLRSLATEWGVGEGKWRVSVGGFGHVIDDGIITSTVPGEEGVFSYENGGRLYLAGVRAKAEVGLPAGLRLRVAHTYQPLARDDSGDRIPLRAEQNYRAELSGSWFGGKLGARAWIDGSARTASPEGSPPVPDYAEVNVGVRWEPMSFAAVGLDLRNLADVRDPTWGPAPGRYGLVTVQLFAR